MFQMPAHQAFSNPNCLDFWTQKTNAVVSVLLQTIPTRPVADVLTAWRSRLHRCQNESMFRRCLSPREREILRRDIARWVDVVRRFLVLSSVGA